MKHHPTMSPSSLPAKNICPRYQGSKTAGHAAQRGTIQHMALEDAFKGRPISVGLEPDEVENVEYAYQFIKSCVEKELAKNVADGQSEVQVSISDSQFNEVSFGTIDFGIGDVIFDYKSGRMRNYTEQMTAYAVGWCQEMGLQKVKVYEVYGREKRYRHYVVDASDGVKLIEEIKAKVDDKTLPPVLCEYCGWCAKKDRCKVRVGSIDQVSKLMVPETKLEVISPAKATDEQLPQLKEVADVIKSWAKDVDDELKSRLDAGKEIDGWEMVEKNGGAFITDILMASKLSKLSAEEFVSACSASIPKLANVVQEKNRLTKKGARELVESRLASVIDHKASTKTLKRTK